MKAGYAADDGVALHFVDDQLFKIISSQQEKRAYQVEVRNGNIHEEEIVPQWLETR